MPHDWIIEVLDDLKSYAEQNRLDELAAQIEDTRLVAMTEIASLPETRRDMPGVPPSPLVRAR